MFYLIYLLKTILNPLTLLFGIAEKGGKGKFYFLWFGKQLADI
jgi:hypothetical protein